MADLRAYSDQLSLLRWSLMSNDGDHTTIVFWVAVSGTPKNGALLRSYLIVK
jgi:hypothetical protein